MPSAIEYVPDAFVGVFVVTPASLNPAEPKAKEYAPVASAPDPKAYESDAVALALFPKAKELGITRVLITCATDNVASNRIIRSNGGILENEVWDEADKEMVCRYWIDL